MCVSVWFVTEAAAGDTAGFNKLLNSIHMLISTDLKWLQAPMEEEATLYYSQCTVITWTNTQAQSHSSHQPHCWFGTLTFRWHPESCTVLELLTAKIHFLVFRCGYQTLKINFGECFAVQVQVLVLLCSDNSPCFSTFFLCPLHLCTKYKISETSLNVIYCF